MYKYSDRILVGDILSVSLGLTLLTHIIKNPFQYLSNILAAL